MACTIANKRSTLGAITASCRLIGPQWRRMVRNPTAAHSTANSGFDLHKS
jgi:hypothetical protein